MTWEEHTAHPPVAGKTRGSLRLLRGLHSPQLDNTRDIIVYLPPSYERTVRRYPVIYMHDGQNLFDPRTSFAGEWNVDDTLDRESALGLEAIVVGIPNMGEERCSEYSPFDDVKHGRGRGDDYLAFISETVKPLVDAEFRTTRERTLTGIAGSSMGGLISLYGFFARSHVFGFAGVMSPSLWYGERKVFSYLDSQRHLPGRIYLDVGTKEGSRALQDVIDLRDRLVRMGYRSGRDLLYVVDQGGAHNEAAWARRLSRELRFLLGASPSASKRPAVDQNGSAP
ncbi:MAG: alpha/beta hydrolase [Longimicrobiales bacterium]